MGSYSIQAVGTDELTVLPRLVGACSRQRLRIESISVANSGEKSCYTIRLSSGLEEVQKLCRQLQKITGVSTLFVEEAQ